MRLLETLAEIKIEAGLALSFLPLMVAIGVLRVLLLDAFAAPYYISDLLTGFIGVFSGLSVLLASRKLSNSRIDVKWISTILSSLILLITLYFSSSLSPSFMKVYASMKIFLPILILEMLISYLFLPRIFDWRFIFPTLSHFFDAASTITSLRYGGHEINLVVRFLNTILGLESILLVKLVVIVPVSYYLVRSEEDYSDAAALLIAGMGIGIGVSNLLV